MLCNINIFLLIIFLIIKCNFIFAQVDNYPPHTHLNCVTGNAQIYYGDLLQSENGLYSLKQLETGDICIYLYNNSQFTKTWCLGVTLPSTQTPFAIYNTGGSFRLIAFDNITKKQFFYKEMGIEQRLPNNDNYWLRTILQNNGDLVTNPGSNATTFSCSTNYLNTSNLCPIQSTCDNCYDCVSLPTNSPTMKPSSIITEIPSLKSTNIPNVEPTFFPSLASYQQNIPSFKPTNLPTFIISKKPTFKPSFKPTIIHTNTPSLNSTLTIKNNTNKKSNTTLIIVMSIFSFIMACLFICLKEYNKIIIFKSNKIIPQKMEIINV